MAIQNIRTQSTPDEHVWSMASSEVQGVSDNALDHLRSGDETGLIFLDDGTYCQACYSSNHVTSTCRHFKTDTQFISGRKSELRIQI